MTYLINVVIIYYFKVLNKIGIHKSFRKRFFSSKKILEKTYKEGDSFTFIQVGANDGISFDFLYDFITKRESLGIVIEPVKEYFNELIYNYKSYPHIIKINKAIHPTEKILQISKVSEKARDKYPEWAKGIASLDPEHHKKINISSCDMVLEEVDAEHLMNVIRENYRMDYLNFFQVDAEGFDYEVLKMLDFKFLKPDIIKYESINLKAKEKKELIKMLQKEGYYLFNEVGDTVGLNLKTLKLF